jgi:Barstar (barnase inhibitor)
MIERPNAVPFKLVSIDTRRIQDWETFHDVFAEIMGFPSFYGRNMNAWIDCMTYLDEPDDGMTSVHTPEGGVLVLQLEHLDDFATRCPSQYAAVINCAAFVNWRRIESGGGPVLVLSFYKS